MSSCSRPWAAVWDAAALGRAVFPTGIAASLAAAEARPVTSQPQHLVFLEGKNFPPLLPDFLRFLRLRQRDPGTPSTDGGIRQL